jgi:prepilin-type N-terminal cleavage/methylation domain-containing protein
MKKTQAFTLIELLIVVAIIAILAAIAVPNFLEAQTRAKVSRVKNDLRTLATALESYKTDTNFYPPFGDVPLGGWDDVNALNPRYLTTPITYITSAQTMIDIFRTHRPKLAWWSHQFYYRNFDDSRCTGATRNWCTNLYGWWRITSCGPDGFIFNGVLGRDDSPYIEITYDPTNGTISAGDIERNQKYTDEYVRKY